jgi:hypothetical protein
MPTLRDATGPITALGDSPVGRQSLMNPSQEAIARGCYCGSIPEHALNPDLPAGYCGICEKCGAPGHLRHFPGAVPYTGAWCDRHYRRIQLFDPRAFPGSVFCVFGLVLLISIGVRLLR